MAVVTGGDGDASLPGRGLGLRHTPGALSLAVQLQADPALHMADITASQGPVERVLGIQLLAGWSCRCRRAGRTPGSSQIVQKNYRYREAKTGPEEKAGGQASTSQCRCLRGSAKYPLENTRREQTLWHQGREDLLLLYTHESHPPLFRSPPLWVGLDKVHTLLNVLLQVWNHVSVVVFLNSEHMSLTSQAGLQQRFLVFGDFAHLVDLLNTVGPELNPGGEEVDSLILEQRAVDKCGLDHPLLALSRLQQALGKAGTSHGHRESRGACTILGLDDFVTTKLDAVDKAVKLLASDVGVARLRKQWHNGDARVATNYGDVLIGGVGPLDFGDESRGTDNVEGGDTKQTLGVVDSLALVDLGADGDGRVDLVSVLAACAGLIEGGPAYRVGDDQNVGVGRSVGGRLGQVTDDAGVGVEEI